MITDEKFSGVTLQLQYHHLTHNATAESVDSMLPLIVDFCAHHQELASSFAKSLVKRLSSQLIDGMAQQEKGIIAWATVATLELISQFICVTADRRFVAPTIVILTTFLRHFPVRSYLPFQLRIALLIHKIETKFEVFVPILSWIVDAIQFLCGCTGKGKCEFNWKTDLASPSVFSFDFCHQALDRLKRLFLADLLGQGQSIAFPEYAMPIKRRLQDVIKTARNVQIAKEVKSLVKALNDQEQFLVKVKRELQWSTVNEQLAQWNAKMEAVETPLFTLVGRQKKVDVQLEKMSTEDSRRYLEEGTGDMIEVATADDV
jgi:hypothetical protein